MRPLYSVAIKVAQANLWCISAQGVHSCGSPPASRRGCV